MKALIIKARMTKSTLFEVASISITINRYIFAMTIKFVTLNL